MQSGWQANLSYDYLKDILKTVKERFELQKFSEALDVLKTGSKNKIFLRHDIDVNLDRALKMAKIEKKLRIESTYFVMTRSPFYSLGSNANKDKLRKLASMGHEIGLHYDFKDDNERQKASNLKDIEDDLVENCNIVRDIIAAEIKSVSFHRPKKEFLRGPFLIKDKINAYSAELMGWYLSDSKGNWREGEPLPMILKPREQTLQLLIHPIWWGEKHMTPEDRVQEFFNESTKGLSLKDKNNFDAELMKNLDVVRSNLKNGMMKNG